MTLAVTPRHALPLLSAGQAQKEIAHNEALILLDFLLNPVVEAMHVNIPPSAPISGQAWIIGTNPSGLWTGHATHIACWSEGGWRFVTPVTGQHVWLLSSATWVVRNATQWAVSVVSTSAVHINGEKIVGERAGAIANPSGGNIIDSECRISISAILSALRSHGLIETGM